MIMYSHCREWPSVISANTTFSNCNHGYYGRHWLQYTHQRMAIILLVVTGLKEQKWTFKYHLLRFRTTVTLVQ